MPREERPNTFPKQSHFPPRSVTPPAGAVEEKTSEDISYMSFSDLAKKNSEMQNPVTHTPQQGARESGNKNALRSALTDILKEKEHVASPEPKTRQTEPPKGDLGEKFAKKTEDSPLSATKNTPLPHVPPQAQKPQEVSEDVLRKILE